MAQQRTQRVRIRPLTVVGVLVFVLALHYTRILQPIENVVVRVLQPVQTTVYSWVNRAPEGELTYAELQEEWKQRGQENEALAVQNAQLKTVVQQTTLLEEQVNFLQEQSYQAVTAKVASRSTDETAHTIIINAGSREGVREGAPVIIDSGVLIGTIESVDEETAAILLLTSFRSRVGATVQNEVHSPAIVQGEHNISLAMGYTPQPDVVTAGDTVVTSGTDDRIPSGLVIGRVVEVTKEPGSLFQEASLDPLFDVDAITIVSVLQL